MAVVRRFYDELWNHWRLDVADEILAEELRFRGSLGQTVSGRKAFRRYVETIRTAFPDWHNRVDEMLAFADRVVTLMTWTGTHRGRFGELEATGARVEYTGVACFRLSSALIDEAWIVGDTQAFWRALGSHGAHEVGPLATRVHGDPPTRTSALCGGHSESD